jgi:hypothetical protein
MIVIIAVNAKGKLTKKRKTYQKKENLPKKGKLTTVFDLFLYFFDFADF